jgi:hypothetical protein
MSKQQMKRRPNIIEAIENKRVFGALPRFRSLDTWGSWLVVLKAIFGLPLTVDDLVIFHRHTGRASPPLGGSKETYLIIGRRGGKSFISALITCFVSCFGDFSQFITVGETLAVMCLARDKDQARIVFKYIKEEMDCGTELDRIAKRNREIDPALTYNDALNLAYLEHPKLATRYLGRPVRIDKVQEVQKYVDAAVVKRYDRTAYGIIANVVTGLPKMNDGSIDMDAAVRAVNDHDQLQAACQEKLEDLVKTQVALDGIAASETMKPEMMNGMRQRVRPRPPSWWKFVFSVSEPEKFLPQLPYNERSQRNQGLAIPLQAAFSTETCLSSCQPSIRRM